MIYYLSFNSSMFTMPASPNKHNSITEIHPIVLMLGAIGIIEVRVAIISGNPRILISTLLFIVLALLEVLLELLQR